MPTPLTLNRTNVQTFGTALSANDFILMALLLEKGPGAEQLVNTADYFTNYSIKDEQLLTRLLGLSGGRDPLIQLTVPSVTLNWVGTPTLNMTEAQIKQQISQGTLDDTTFITYAAVLLNKGASPTQMVNPADYGTSREMGGWGLAQPTFLRELITLSTRTEMNFSLDIPALTVLWLKTVHS